MSSSSRVRRATLMRSPAVLAWTLETRRRVSLAWGAVRSRPVRLAAFGAAALIAAAVMTYLAQLRAIREALEWLVAHPWLTALAAALYAVLDVSRRRVHLAAERHSSWLIAAPLPTHARRAVEIARIALAATTQWTLAAFVVGVIGLIAREPGTWMMLGALASGAAGGTLVGSVWPVRATSPRNEDSRYVLKRRSRAERPSLAGLSQWPIATALAWHRPENSRWLFIAAALSVPMGTSALLGVAILAVWSLGSYLVAVVRWLPSVARDAALWLRPTTISFPQFACALVRNVLVHECIGTAVLGGVLLSMGATFVGVLYAATLWFALVLMICAISTRQSFLGHASTARILLAAALVVATELRARGWGIGLATAMTLVHCRGTARVRT